jgi:hypothetical protein
MAPRLIWNNIEVWLQHAIDLDSDIRRLALDDEDLRPVARLDGADFLISGGSVSKQRLYTQREGCSGGGGKGLEMCSERPFDDLRE